MSEGSGSLYRQHAAVESAPLEGECILYDPGTNRFMRLNRTASFIWGRIKEPASAEEIAAALAGSFSGVEPSVAARDVRATLDELLAMSVAEAVTPESATSHRQGENR